MEEDIELSAWKLWLHNIILGVVFGVFALLAAWWGVDHQQSIYCRSKSDPSVYGTEFCILPVAKTPQPKAGGSAYTLCPVPPIMLTGHVRCLLSFWA